MVMLGGGCGATATVLEASGLKSLWDTGLGGARLWGLRSKFVWVYDRGYCT